MDINNMTGEEYYAYFKKCASCTHCLGLSGEGLRKCKCADQPEVDAVRAFCPDYVHDPRYTLTDDGGNYIGSAPAAPAKYNDNDDDTALFDLGSDWGKAIATSPDDFIDDDPTTRRLNGLSEILKGVRPARKQAPLVSIPESDLATGVEYDPDNDDDEDDEDNTPAGLSKKGILMIVAACIIALGAAIFILSKTSFGLDSVPKDRPDYSDIYSEKPQASPDEKADEKEDGAGKASPSPSPKKEEKVKKLAEKLDGTWVRYTRDENKIDVEELTFKSSDGTYTLSKYSYVNDMYFGRRPEGDDIWYIDSGSGDTETVRGMFTASDSGELTMTGDRVKTSYVNLSAGDGIYIDGLMYASKANVKNVDAAAKIFGFDLEPSTGKYDELAKKLDGRWVTASRSGDTVYVTTIEFNYTNGKFTKAKTAYVNKASGSGSSANTDSDGWYASSDGQRTYSGNYSVTGEATITLEYTYDSAVSGSFSDVTIVSFTMYDSSTLYIDGVNYTSGMYGASIRDLGSYFGFSPDAPKKTVTISDVYREKAAEGSGYWLLDMDSDGTAELILLIGSGNDKQLTVYSYNNGALKNMGSVSAGGCDVYGNVNGGLVLVYSEDSYQSVRNITVYGGSVVETVAMELQKVDEYMVPDNAYAITPHSPSDTGPIDNLS